jgi:hypothetical protein
VICRVRVKCEGWRPPAQIGAKGKAGKRTPWAEYVVCLVEVASLDEAFEVGRVYAECQVSPAAHWECFTPMSASPVLFPVRVDGLL